MPEVNNCKRKRANRSSYIVNPNGNYTPSASDTDDDDDQDHLIHRKIVRRESADEETESIQLNDADDSNGSASSSTSSFNRDRQGNIQLLYAALQTIDDLENGLAEIADVDYDSGHQDEGDADEENTIDEGNGSDLDDNAQLHNHRNEILDAQPEALGYAYCVKEAFDFLAAQGVNDDNPIVQALRERFLGQCNQVPPTQQ